MKYFVAWLLYGVCLSMTFNQFQKNYFTKDFLYEINKVYPVELNKALVLTQKGFSLLNLDTSDIIYRVDEDIYQI